MNAARMILPMLLVASTPAFAQDAAPEAAAPSDPRLVELPYDQNRVVTIYGQPKVQATVRFGENEMIENVAIGDSGSWQVTPNKRANLLLLKPLAERASTNMTVVTNRHTYLFDLVAGPKTQPIYVLSFTYPDDPAEEDAPEMLASGANALEMQAATDPYAVADPTTLNFKWSAQGDRKLLPQRTFDDGDATFLSWDAGRSVPAILIRNDEGDLGPVNYAVRGDTIVVEGVFREIILRSGDDEATLTNEGPVRRPTASAGSALARAGGND